MGKDDVENSGTIKPASLICTPVKAYKTLAKEEPAMRTHAVREIALLRNPKTMAEALRTLQRVEWMDAINKEMSSFVDKEVYEVRKLPIDRNLCQDLCFLQWVIKIVKSKILHCKKASSNNDMSLL